MHFRSKIFDKTIFAFLKKYDYYKNINFVKFFCKAFFDKTSQNFAKSFSFLNILLVFSLNILKNLLEKCRSRANFVKREYIQSSTLMLTGEKRRRYERFKIFGRFACSLRSFCAFCYAVSNKQLPSC